MSVSVRADDSAALYKAKCVSCHGTDSKGDTAAGKKLSARDFTSPDVQKETDAQLIDIIAKGKNKMPAYTKSLKEPQIKDLAAFVRGLGKK
jgi:mono/diheme cytochrome c family protein